MKEKLLTLLDGQQLRDLVCKYYPDNDQIYANYNKQLRAGRFVVPVAGVQGSGKSTLLNAIAFDVPVLPIDADETTCVPVEIVWSSNPIPLATAYYADGHSTVLPCTEEGLRDIVHHERNPGNVQQVARVVLESNRELFRHGLVLVDLPGTGSLTSANMQTTQNYLKEAVGVAFMLRTVPPITRSEATFIALQWASLQTAFFVQNRWNDETNDEASAGHDHNTKILQDIARKARISLEGEPTIFVVNGYDALRSAFNQDSRLAEDSGLIDLTKTLGKFSENWGINLSINIRNALLQDLAAVEQQREKRLSEASLDEGKLRQQIADDELRFERYLLDIDQRASTIRQDYQDFQLRQRLQLRSWATSKSGELRNLMRTKMRAGIVDGKRLARALADEQSIATDDIFVRAQEDVLTLQDQLRSDLEGLNGWNAVKPDARFTVDKEEATKWESVADKAAGAFGGVGGFWAGVQAGTFVGTPGGPVSVLIGAAIGGLLGGCAGSWLGSWLGGKGRSAVNGQRIKAVEPEVFDAIDQYVNYISSTLRKSIDDFCAVIDNVLKNWRNDQIASFEAERGRTRKDSQQTQTEKDQMIIGLQKEQKSLQELAGQLKELRA